MTNADETDRHGRKRRTTFMIDEEDAVELEEIAHAQRVSLAWVLRDAVKRYLADRAPLLRQENRVTPGQKS